MTKRDARWQGFEMNLPPARTIDSFWRRASRLRRIILSVQIAWAWRRESRRLATWAAVNAELGLDIEVPRVKRYDPDALTSLPLVIRDR